MRLSERGSFMHARLIHSSIHSFIQAPHPTSFLPSCLQSGSPGAPVRRSVDTFQGNETWAPWRSFSPHFYSVLFFLKSSSWKYLANTGEEKKKKKTLRKEKQAVLEPPTPHLLWYYLLLLSARWYDFCSSVCCSSELLLCFSCGSAVRSNRGGAAGVTDSPPCASNHPFGSLLMARQFSVPFHFLSN